MPYRNSMMTSVLRDSLGGNCKTVMVATVSPEELALDESVSTCRFAQRVALISNRLELNEEVDPKLLIARLKAQVLASLGRCCCCAGGHGHWTVLEHEQVLASLGKVLLWWPAARARALPRRHRTAGPPVSALLLLTRSVHLYCGILNLYSCASILLPLARLCDCDLSC